MVNVPSLVREDGREVLRKGIMELKVVTYNIDGLPGVIDLNGLPWHLKPFSWLYRALKGTTCVTVNDNGDRAESTLEISRRLSELDADIIAVQEDFNYHAELMDSLLCYSTGRHMGGIAFENIRWWPYPKFKADGLNILATSYVFDELIMPWEKSHGYFKHANDKLTTKGFRYFSVKKKGCWIDVFVVHMDADFYDPVKCPDVSKDVAARKSQFEQLANMINCLDDGGPLIVMGDFNSYPKYEWDCQNVSQFLDSVPGLQEAKPDNQLDCDHIFYRGLTLKDCYSDLSFGNLSDHKPLVAEFEI